MFGKKVINNTKEVSLEHVSEKKIYVTVNKNPNLISYNIHDMNIKIIHNLYCKPHSLDLRANGIHTVELHEPCTIDGNYYEDKLRSYIGQLLRKENFEVYEFDNLFEFCSWVVNLKPHYNKPKYVKIQHEDCPGRIHYSDCNGLPLCGCAVSHGTPWQEVDGNANCLRCLNIVARKTPRFSCIWDRIDDKEF